jgi:type II secretory pathway component PulK
LKLRHAAADPSDTAALLNQSGARILNTSFKPDPRTRGSLLIIVLWVVFGLVAITLYFANEMSLELHASDNRVSGLASEQAIDGAMRYAGYILTNQIVNGTNGNIPDPASYQSEAVPVGDAHFWFIGRDNNSQSQPGEVTFGLIDEGSKLNLNTASATNLYWLPNMTSEIAANIVDWRNTNGTTSVDGDGPTVYSALGYTAKNLPFETVDELRLVYGMNMDLFAGEDANHNGVLDANEIDANGNGTAAPGISEYVTVYSREPNPPGKVNISSLTTATAGPLRSLLQTNLTTTKATQILRKLGLVATGRGAGVVTVTFKSPLDFYLKSGMAEADFATIATNLTMTNSPYIKGRVNVNTASATVLACLLNGDTASAQQLVSYRLVNPGSLSSIAWVSDALTGNPAALSTLRAHDNLTTQSFQFTADIAALGPNGRGYRRVRFVFDTATGTPTLIYRQDLTRLGWALGKDARQTWLFAKDSQ